MNLFSANLTAETLQRQKKRRDRLAEALPVLCKKTLSQVELDINLLTGKYSDRSPSSSSTPLTTICLSPKFKFSQYKHNATGQQQQQQQSYHHPSYYQQQSAPNPTTGYSDQLYTDHDGRMNNYLDEGEDEDSEYEEELPEPWECSMCTFRNHPQLNICETCENVRILPGTLPNLSNAFSAAANTAAAVASGRTINNANNSSSSSLNSSASGGVGLNVSNANIEHDTNL
ncbi:hypothetical protein DOY81_013331, partial [Sarcophaga bullata]